MTRSPFAHRLVKFLASVAFATAVLVGPANAAQPNDRPLLQNLLLDGDFNRLEQQLSRAESSYLDGHESESVVSGAYTNFASVDPALERQLDAWAAAYPDSHRPFLARGIFHHNIGWLQRGTYSIRFTTDQQISLLNGRFTRAANDFRFVLQRKPELGLTYSYLINILMSDGRYAEIDGLVEKGLAADPRSYSIRSRYLHSLNPRWSGSRFYKDKSIAKIVAENIQRRHYPVFVPIEMQRFVKLIEEDAANEPSLKPLVGYIEFAVAEELALSGRREEAVEYYDRANQLAGDSSYLNAASVNLYFLDRDDEALAHFDRRLETDPFDETALLYRARIYWIKKDYGEALATIERALARSPIDPKLVRAKSDILTASRKRDAAIEFFDNAFVYGYANHDLYYARGNMHIHNAGGRTMDAENDMRHATELMPYMAVYWFGYGRAASLKLNCTAIGAYQKYLELCELRSNDCPDDNLAVARSFLATENIEQYCFGPSGPA